jgi:hypothetical protein
LQSELPPSNVQKAENSPKKTGNDRNSAAKKQKKPESIF